MKTVSHEQPVYKTDFPVGILLHKGQLHRVVDPHWHNSVEMTYVLKGTPGIARIGEQTYQLATEMMILINSNVIHSFDTYITPNDEILTLLFPLEWLVSERVPRNEIRFMDQPVSLVGSDYARIRQCLQNIASQERQGETTTVASIKMLQDLHDIASQILRRFLILTKREDDVTVLPEDIQQIQAELRQRYAERIDLQAFSNAHNLSPQYFSKYFRSFAGVSPREYLISVRLEQAEKLLRTTTLTVNEVAEQTGFGSAKNFFTLFKKHYEQTPSQYRRARNELR
ncbi:helix-turn-helix domain-containing protein [Furfurilactobacillus sp. WILCCON 0119]